MKIPAKFQVFDQPVVFSSKDEQRLSPFLSGWMHLAELLKDITEADLTLLVILELLGKQRRKILGRLLMRLGRVQRKRIEERIAKCLPSKALSRRCARSKKSSSPRKRSKRK